MNIQVCNTGPRDRIHACLSGETETKLTLCGRWLKPRPGGEATLPVSSVTCRRCLHSIAKEAP